MAEIVLDRVSTVYSGGVKGVNDLSLEISDGEFMVLVGPSGCGKSTALRSIAGLEEIRAAHRTGGAHREPAVLRPRQRAGDRSPGVIRRLTGRGQRDRPTRDRAMTSRWIWFVPSTICSTLASRRKRSAGKSSTYP